VPGTPASLPAIFGARPIGRQANPPVAPCLSATRTGHHGCESFRSGNGALGSAEPSHEPFMGHYDGMAAGLAWAWNAGFHCSSAPELISATPGHTDPARV
jgi:hypothetical protein